MTEQDKKLHALIAQWREGSNKAMTADESLTYAECADDLEATIAAQILVAVCEGCETKIPMPTKSARKPYPDLPAGWSQSGASSLRLKGHGVRLAAWCPSCRTGRSPR